MPRKTIEQKAGESIAAPVRQFLLTQFEAVDIEKIETLGGVVEILISTSPRGIKRRKNLQIDTEYLNKLADISQDSKKLNDELESLTLAQTRSICEMLSLPAPTSLTKRELLRGLNNHLRSRKSWGAIMQSGEITKG